ncbi:hypothetical protein [Hyphobacterium sp.]|uniref:hypothetical protein n=1 Tax=Hyphobacterium sp. TaxID=2004662 RepID=UPI00374929C4
MGLASQTDDGAPDTIFVDLVYEFSITNNEDEPVCIPSDLLTRTIVANAFQMVLEDGSLEVREYDAGGAIDFDAIDWVSLAPGQSANVTQRIIERVAHPSLHRWRSIAVRYLYIDCSILDLTDKQRERQDDALISHGLSEPHEFSISAMRLTNIID